MKKNNLIKILIAISIVFCVFQVNAENHLNNSSSKEILPGNRTAFLFCYNNSISYKNPAMAVLNNNVKHNPAPPAAKNTTTVKQDEVCMFSNLTEDELWVEIENKKVQDQKLQLEIYNANGEIVYNTKIEQNLHKVNVCDFTAGTFLVKLGDDVQKLVIE